MSESTQIAPMGVSGVEHLVERAHRESGEFQYLRELLMNALEAGSTRIEFGPEWNAVADHDVYRLMVADNGRGMNPDELLRFLNTFGGGGKPIGEAHENYGVGAKTSLLPWNHEGVVVLSWTQENPEGAMMWLARDASSGQYGARKIETPDGYEEVVLPFGEWKSVRPKWLKEQGTVVVCLGNTGTEDTFLGRDGKGDIKGISSYLNKRIWKVPTGVKIRVQELRSSKRFSWPRSIDEASGPAAASGPDRRWNNREVRGAAYYALDIRSRGELGAKGTVVLPDKTEIDWYLWAGDRPSVHTYAHENGYIAALYKNELYDERTHFAHFRSFGIHQSAVRSKLTLIARPPQTDGSFGVYPDTARSALKIQGDKRAGEPLPWAEWAQDFAEQMPEQIRVALNKAGPTSGGTIKDPSWRNRLADRFAARWSTLRYRKNPTGEHKIDPNQAEGSHGGSDSAGVGSGDGAGNKPGHLGQQDGPASMATSASPKGEVTAKAIRTKGGLPDMEWTSLAEIDESERYAAVWCTPSKARPCGLVLVARDFATFVEVKQHWRGQYPEHLGERIDAVIEEVYGEAMVARLAHSEQLVTDPKWGRAMVNDKLRSPEALTMAVLGLLSEDYTISQRLKGLGVRRKKLS